MCTTLCLPKGFAGYRSRSCLRATAPRLWADSERGDLRLAVHAMNIDCSDEMVVRAEVTIFPCEQSADHGQSFRRRYSQPRRHLRAQVCDGVVDVRDEHDVPD